MTSLSTIALGVGVAAFVVSAAFADPYKDWTPEKGVWQVTAVKVDPNHIDDYLVGLKRAWVPGEEMSKKHGVIDAYFVKINPNTADPNGNVLLGEHFVSFAAMDPNKTRDTEMMNEALAKMSKEQGAKLTNGFDKYRSFVGEAMWQDVSFGK